MKRIVIDTNVYSFLLRGRKDIAQFLSTYDSVLVPAVVLGELEAVLGRDLVMSRTKLRSRSSSLFRVFGSWMSQVQPQRHTGESMQNYRLSVQ